MIPELASSILKYFKDELLHSIDNLILRLSSEQHFKPLVELTDISDFISCIQESEENYNWVELYWQLKELHKHVLSKYFEYRKVVPVKVYSETVFRLKLYSIIIERGM